MEPRDMHVAQLNPRINGKSGQGVSSHHAGGAQVVFGDGSVRFLVDEEISPDVLGALFTRAGGETLVKTKEGLRLIAPSGD